MGSGVCLVLNYQTATVVHTAIWLGIHDLGIHDFASVMSQGDAITGCFANLQ